jgi:hypothetical protein
LLGASQDSVYYYSPNGERIIDTAMSPNGFIERYFDKDLRYYRWDAYFEDKRLYVDRGVFSISFKLLTAQPLAITTFKKLSPQMVKQILQRFTLSSYLNSENFYDHLKDFTEEKKLSKAYITETLGKPTQISQANDLNNERWTYPALKLELFFDDTLVTAFKSKNYAGHIHKREDKVENVKYFEVPSDKYFSLTKVINKGRVHYTLELYSEDDIYSETAPIRILLKNGKILSRNVDAMKPEGSPEIKTFARLYLSQQEAQALATSLVNEFKLGDAHEVMPAENAENLYYYFKALINIK